MCGCACGSILGPGFRGSTSVPNAFREDRPPSIGPALARACGAMSPCGSPHFQALPQGVSETCRVIDSASRGRSVASEADAKQAEVAEGEHTPQPRCAALVLGVAFATSLVGVAVSSGKRACAWPASRACARLPPLSSRRQASRRAASRAAPHRSSSAGPPPEYLDKPPRDAQATR